MMIDLYVFVDVSIFPSFENIMKKYSTTKNATAAAASVASIVPFTVIASAFLTEEAVSLTKFFASSSN